MTIIEGVLKQAGQPDELIPLAVDKNGFLSTASSNITGKFREAFEGYDPINGGRWIENKATGDLIFVDGNAAAASYLVISKDPLSAGTESSIEQLEALHFRMPTEIAVACSMSQRTLGQEFAIEAVDTSEPLADVPDIAIASITQTTTTLTIDTVSPHGLSVGKSIGIYGCSDLRANYSALVVASIPTPTQITCTAGPSGTIASQTIANPAGAKGSIYFRQRLGRASNGVSQIFENTTVTNASIYLRSESGDALPSGTIAGNHTTTVGTTASVQLVNSPNTYAFGATTEYRMLLQSDRVQVADAAVDAVTQLTARATRTQVCPDPDEPYKLRFRATNNKALTVPIAQIVSAVKTGTTTATIITDRPHGLVLADPVVIYGIRAQGATEFPNLVTATAVASVIDATTFTIVIGTAGTVTSYGGYVAEVQGGNLMSSLGANAVVAQSATLSTLSDGTRQLVLIGNTNWGGLSIGDLANLVGCRDNVSGATMSLDGPWKVANFVTTALTLVLPFSGQRVLPADFASVNCGGGIIKRTCLRVSFVRVFDYERLRVEALSRPTSDAASSSPVNVQNIPAVTQSGTWNIGTAGQGAAAAVSATTGLGGWYIHPVIAGIPDVASAAITATATSAAVANNLGNGFQVTFPVTAVTGTNPTLDIRIEESFDGGTNWVTLYEMQRITATGSYNTPILRASGRNIRYVRTISGTSPSFTMAVTRNVLPFIQAEPQKRLMDRSIVLTTLNSTTPTLFSGAANNLQLTVNIGTATTPPALQLQGSEDGVNFYDVGTPLTAVASNTVQYTLDGISCTFARVRVSTAGATVVAGYVSLKAWS